MIPLYEFNRVSSVSFYTSTRKEKNCWKEAVSDAIRKNWQFQAI